LENVISLGLIHGEGTFFWAPEQSFVIIRKIRLEVLLTLNGTFILNELMNTFLPMSAIDHTMEVPRIRISFKKKLALRPLVPFDFLLME
jgi:hypothetical protein